MENKIKLKINNIDIEVNPGTTILQACRDNNIYVPTLCHIKDVHKIGVCKVCVVEILDTNKIVPSCIFMCKEGINISTNSPNAISERKKYINAILSKHDTQCLVCTRNNSCSLQKVASENTCNLEINDLQSFLTKKDESLESVVYDASKCITCHRCITACNKTQAVGAIKMDTTDRTKQFVTNAVGVDLASSGCTGCGQCNLVCPTAAFEAKDDTKRIIEAINDPEIITVVAPAPSVRVSIGEEFGYPIGTNVEKKLVTSLKRFGFDFVFDVDFGADMTIIEEANELVKRFNANSKLPMFTSCCPAWVNYLTYFYPELIPHLSSAKSPVQMLGSAIKTYWSKKNNYDHKKVFFVSVMPCTAKKEEIWKGEQAVDGTYDTDAIITVRQMSKLFKQQGILLNKMDDTDFDNPLGESSGGGDIFGASGGVMESAVRTAKHIILNENDDARIEFKQLRGSDGIKESDIKIGDKTIRLCVASGLANAKKVVEQVKSGEKNYDFIEIMACPGGCINGGGMPIHDYDNDGITWQEIAAKRASGLYNMDANKKIRHAHNNTCLIKMYDEFFNKDKHLIHKCLHTSFKPKQK